MLEVGTFRLVEDHPNAVRVLELFEGAECYYVVMECCEGGELFDHISKKQVRPHARARDVQLCVWQGRTGKGEVREGQGREKFMPPCRSQAMVCTRG